MEKRLRTNSQVNRARHFLKCVILEQRAATEELRASNNELDCLLNELMATRTELRSLGAEEPEAKASSPEPPDSDDLRVTELRKEVETVVAEASSAIQASVRLRRRSERIREALRATSGAKPTQGQRLSRREHQVLTLIVEGKSSKEIAAALGISFKTAVTHRASIMSKLDVHEIASVVREAIRRGLV